MAQIVGSLFKALLLAECLLACFSLMGEFWAGKLISFMGRCLQAGLEYCFFGFGPLITGHFFIFVRMDQSLGLIMFYLNLAGC